MSTQKRILLAKMGLDCHDTGIVTVAQILRDAGYEVVYLGLHNDARQVIKVATEEDVDAIGISFLSGQHMTQVRRLLDEMRRSGLAVPVICGGIIPDEDARALREMGVAEVIPAGTLSAEVARRVAGSLAEPA
ncbi:cobalamin B12-binding domain-containing protein [Aromatoleum sp.]|uniref:cobalamin B12-binding domain-containing protein n=1 Tax=Aromatoleum sp. TaxID=2307007 RepID=UPI002FCC055B